MSGRGWVVAQVALAVSLLVASAVVIVGAFVVRVPELVPTFPGAIQAIAVFPGLALSLLVNARLMRGRRVSGVERVLLGLEFAVVAGLVVIQTFRESSAPLGYGMILWPAVIVLAVAIAAVAAARRRPVRPGPDEVAEDAALDAGR